MVVHKYHGNPLAYYKKHYEQYKGMNRKDLSVYDSGLYRALLRAGQIEEAIPDSNLLFVESGRKGGKVKKFYTEGDLMAGFFIKSY